MTTSLLPSSRPSSPPRSHRRLPPSDRFGSGQAASMRLTSTRPIIPGSFFLKCIQTSQGPGGNRLCRRPSLSGRGHSLLIGLSRRGCPDPVLVNRNFAAARAGKHLPQSLIALGDRAVVGDELLLRSSLATAWRIRELTHWPQVSHDARRPSGPAPDRPRSSSTWSRLS